MNEQCFVEILNIYKGIIATLVSIIFFPALVLSIRYLAKRDVE